MADDEGNQRACAECPLPTSQQTDQIPRKSISFGPLRKKENGHLYYATAALPGGPQLNVGDVTLIPFQEEGLGEASGEVKNSLLADEALAEIHSIWYCRKNRIPYAEVRWYFRPNELMDEVTGALPPRHHMIKGNVYNEIPLHSCRARCTVRQKAVPSDTLEEREQRQVVASMYLDQHDTLRPQQFEFILFPTAKALARSGQYRPQGARPHRPRSRSQRRGGNSTPSALASPTAEAEVFSHAIARDSIGRSRGEMSEDEGGADNDVPAKRPKLAARGRKGGRRRREDEDEDEEEGEEGEEEAEEEKTERGGKGNGGVQATARRRRPAQQQSGQQQGEAGAKSTGNIFSLLMRRTTGEGEGEGETQEEEAAGQVSGRRKRARPRQREDEENEATQREAEDAVAAVAEDDEEDDDDDDDEDGEGQREAAQKVEEEDGGTPPARAQRTGRRPAARIDDSEEEDEGEEEEEEEHKAAKEATGEEDDEDEDEDDVIMSQPLRAPRVVFIDSDDEEEADEPPYRRMKQPPPRAAAAVKGRRSDQDTSDESDGSSSDGLDAGLPEAFDNETPKGDKGSSQGAAVARAGEEEGGGGKGKREAEEDGKAGEEGVEETVVNGEPLVDTSLSSFVERQLAGESATASQEDKALTARFKPAVDFVWRLTHAALSRKGGSDSTGTDAGARK